MKVIVFILVLFFFYAQQVCVSTQYCLAPKIFYKSNHIPQSREQIITSIKEIRRKLGNYLGVKFKDTIPSDEMLIRAVQEQIDVALWPRTREGRMFYTIPRDEMILAKLLEKKQRKQLGKSIKKVNVILNKLYETKGVTYLSEAMLYVVKKETTNELFKRSNQAAFASSLINRVVISEKTVTEPFLLQILVHETIHLSGIGYFFGMWDEAVTDFLTLMALRKSKEKPMLKGYVRELEIFSFLNDIPEQTVKDLYFRGSLDLFKGHMNLDRFKLVVDVYRYQLMYTPIDLSVLNRYCYQLLNKEKPVIGLTDAIFFLKQQPVPMTQIQRFIYRSS